MEQKRHIGDFFKDRRQEMNLTLREVENATSIRSSYLKAIEDGALGQAISPVYAKGFIKQYALFLGLDGDTIIRDNPQAFSSPEKQEFTYGIGTLEMRGNPGGGVKWLPNVAWLAATVGIILAAWYFAKYLEVL